MRLLYLSTVCAQSRFDRLVEEGRIAKQFQNQKFHHLILEGLATTGEKEIHVISYYPVLEKYLTRVSPHFEEENGIYYHYPGFTNKPVDGFVSRIIAVYKSLKTLYTNDSVVVCNIMNFEACIAARVFRLFHKIKIVAIVADVPGNTAKIISINKDLPIYKRYPVFLYNILKEWVCLKGKNNYDAYVLLTKAMNEVVNKKKRPFIVVEGLSDIKKKQASKTAESKSEKFTVMYAGGIKKEYGAELLVKGFHQIHKDDIELHIYGYGPYVKEIAEINKEDSRIKYLGTKTNQEIVALQKQAHLLINPRPTNQEFVKYSFPSKIMECMSSGTPLLTTVIPGMPEEYYPYVYLIKDENLKGFSNALEDVINKTDEELFQKGRAAQEFILENKNNVVQAKRILALLKSVTSQTIQ